MPLATLSLDLVAEDDGLLSEQGDGEERALEGGGVDMRRQPGARLVPVIQCDWMMRLYGVGSSIQ